MKILTVAAAFAFLTILAVVVAGLAQHKKSSSRTLNLIGAIGLVITDLDPEGSVIIDGELWRARTPNGSALTARVRVRVVGQKSHLVLVEQTD
jgi:membrane-bound serine protease (ClpP class)